MSASACLPRQSGDAAEASASTPTAIASPRLRCASGPEHAIALLEPGRPDHEQRSEPARGRCGVALALADGRLSVHAIPELEDGSAGPGVEGGAGALASGPVPEACGPALERCELWGVDDALGPIVLAAVRGPESEVPIQVYVGWIEGERLGFAPSWFGLSSVADHTRVGPPWALAPHACGDGRMHLLPSPRLPEAEVEAPSEALRGVAGRWAIAEDGSASLAEPAAADPGDCRPVFVAIP